MELFKGVCPVVNIPFFDDETIDYDSLKSIVEFLLVEGCSSICLFAFNSEPHKITFDEKKTVIEKFITYVNKRADTLIGIVENSILGCIELAKYAELCNAKGIILYPPSISTPSGGNLLNYFKSIACSVKIPIMIQDNPRSTGVFMSTELLLEANHEIDNFHYLKVECPIPIRKMKKIIELTDGKLKCYSGNGGIFAVDAYNAGAWGIMPGVVTVGYFIKIYKYVEAGNIDMARTIFENLLPLIWYEDQSMEFFIACEKELLKKMNIISSAKVRSPACILDETERRELFVLFSRLKSF